MARRQIRPKARCQRTHGVTYESKRDLIADRKSFGLNNDQAKSYRCLDCGRWHLYLAGRERVAVPSHSLPTPEGGA